MTEQEIVRFGIYQSRGRVVLPIYHKEVPIGYQTRGFGKGPKYLTFTRPGSTRPLIFKVSGRGRHIEGGEAPECTINRGGGDIIPDLPGSSWTRLYIVEDILSAIRLSRILWDTEVWAILGSPKRLSVGTLDDIREWEERQASPCQVSIWFDFDKRLESLKVCKQVRELISVPCFPIWTQEDPKALSDQEVYETVKINMG